MYIKQNNDIKESVIHASQAFTQIAMALDGDQFQKDKFDTIKINILNRIDKVVASAKIDMNQLIEKIEFKLE